MKINNIDIGNLVEIPLNNPEETVPNRIKVVHSEIDTQSVIKPSSIKELEKSKKLEKSPISGNDNSPAAETAKKINGLISRKLYSMSTSKKYENVEVDPRISFD